MLLTSGTIIHKPRAAFAEARLAFETALLNNFYMFRKENPDKDTDELEQKLAQCLWKLNLLDREIHEVCSDVEDAINYFDAN